MASLMMTELDVEKLRGDFPVLTAEHGGRRLHYLDSGSSSQKPRQVLETMDDFYSTTYANVHRGVYGISEEASSRYEAVRGVVARFINAASEREIVFTKNVTEAFNLIAYSWGRANLVAGDVVVLTEMEHHANVVPWHILANERGIELRFIPLADDYTLDLSNLDQLLDGAKAVSFTAMSNVLGTRPPMRQLIDAAHAVGAIAIVDAAQHVPHYPLDVQALGADFVGFTGHKMLGPTGIGVLWGREELFDAMPPFLGGGDMILDVSKEGFTPNLLPWKFEAGTPPIVEVIGLGAAISYLESVGFDAIGQHEHTLTAYAMKQLTEHFGNDLTIFGPTDISQRGGVISFALKDVHAHDVAQILDAHNVCVRAGHHCAKPLMRCLGVAATARASLYLYNDEQDIDALVTALDDAARMFA